MAEALMQLRAFLDAHPRQVVIVSLESSVPARAIEAQFERAGLVSRIAVLRRDAPLPTLGELLGRHKQLVVFGDHDTASVPWYADAATFVQDTPVDAASCRLRTGNAASPFLQVNHWIDAFPPRPSQAKRIGSASRLRERVRRCARKRGLPVSLLAVDYYDQGDAVGVARRVNVEGRTGGAP